MPPRDRVADSSTSNEAGTGVACRVCELDDGEPRAQRDLHVACVERATNRALRRAHNREANRIDREREGRPLDRSELIARLAAERAPLEQAAAEPAKRRGPKPRPDRDQHEEEMSEVLFTADESAAIEMISRGGGLSTDGLGGGPDDV